MQIIQRHLQHRAQAHVQRGLVEEEFRRMIRRRLAGVLALRGGADEEEEAGHFAGVEREVLGAHVQAHFDDVLLAGRAFQAGQQLGGQRRVVDGHRVALGVRDLRHRGRAVRGGDVFGDVLQVLEHCLAHAFVEGADGADHFHLVGNDVVADAALDRAEGDDHRQLRDVLAAADDGLRGADDIGRGDDRVDAAPRPRTVRLPALDHDVEAVRRRHRRAGAITDLPGVEGAEHVQAEHRLGFEVAEEALLQHFLGAALLAVRRAFLGRLEDEQYFARQVGLHRHHRFGHAHQGRGVGVVAAGVHHADGLAAEGRGDLGRERQRVAFGHRQRVHVGADRDARAGLAALEHRDHAGGGDAGLHVQAERAQVVGDEFRCAYFAVAEFRVLVDVAAPGQHFRAEPFGLGAHFGPRHVGGVRERRAERAGEARGGEGQGEQGRAHAVGSPVSQAMLTHVARRPPVGAAEAAMHHGLSTAEGWSRLSARHRGFRRSYRAGVLALVKPHRACEASRFARRRPHPCPNPQPSVRSKATPR